MSTHAIPHATPSHATFQSGKIREKLQFFAVFSLFFRVIRAKSQFPPKKKMDLPRKFWNPIQKGYMRILIKDLSKSHTTSY